MNLTYKIVCFVCQNEDPRRKHRGIIPKKIKY
jgi:hypothetical protein